MLAFIITIMVLELKVPHGSDSSALAPLWPVFLSYVMSFIHVAIYWNNHHMLQAVSRINGGILWANLHLLFWLSLVPFVTGWMGRLSLILYALAIGLCFVHPALGGSIYAIVALLWLIPDRRIERVVRERQKEN